MEDYIKELENENAKYKDIIKQLKESIDFYEKYNVDEIELIDNLTEILNKVKL